MNGRPFHASLMPLQPASAAAIEMCFAAFGNSKSTPTLDSAKPTRRVTYVNRCASATVALTRRVGLASVTLRGEQRAQGGAFSLRQARRPHIHQQHHPLPGPFVRNLVLEAIVEHRALALAAPGN
eukprot:COSAG04_NODE_91_length_26852_cov_8.609315_24_plen_125_part_00